MCICVCEITSEVIENDQVALRVMSGDEDVGLGHLLSDSDGRGKVQRNQIQNAERKGDREQVKEGEEEAGGRETGVERGPKFPS